MFRNETFKLLLSRFNSLPFSIGNNTRNFLCFTFKMADKVAVLKLTFYHLLKTLDIRQTLHCLVIQILFTGMFYFFIPLFCYEAMIEVEQTESGGDLSF